jgi:hypothetical protein
MTSKKTTVQNEELQKMQKQLDNFENQVKDLTLDRMNQAPNEEKKDPAISKKDLEKAGENYIKPTRWIADNQKFNPKFEGEWEYQKQYVKCIPTHNESRGDLIEFWTHPFGGKGAEFWQVPSDKPVWMPRYAAEQLTKCKYHRLRMEEKSHRNSDHTGTYFGTMVADTTVQRIDCHPVNSQKSVFMGAAA